MRYVFDMKIKDVMIYYMFQYTILDAVKRPFVIYKDIFQNEYCLEPRKGKNAKSSMIISLPHAGIHIMQSIFEELDLFHVRINYDKTSVHDYRFLTDEDRIKFSRKYDNYTFNFSDSYKWLSTGQYVYSHLKYDDDMYLLLRDSKYVMYLYKRNLRACLISHAKYKSFGITQSTYNLMEWYIRQPYYHEIMEIAKMMLPWFVNDTFDVIRYEDLMTVDVDEKTRTLSKIIDDIGSTKNIRNIVNDTKSIIDKCLQGTEIINWTEYWNDDIEKWFADTGILQLNRSFGYEDV